MKFDDILIQIGEFGRYQKWVYFLAAAPCILTAFEALSTLFIFYIPDHRCAIPGYESDTFIVQNENHSLLLNQTIPLTNGKWDQCNLYSNSTHGVNQTLYLADNASVVTVPEKSRCDKWVYDYSIFDATIPTENGVLAYWRAICATSYQSGFSQEGDFRWMLHIPCIIPLCRRGLEFDIVCQYTWIRASSNMLSEVGNMFGTAVIGFIADRFGRKIPFCIGGIGLIAAGLGIAFVQNIATLNLCRFLLGVTRIAVFTNGLVIGMEMVGPSKRTFAGMMIELAWCLGEFLLLLFAYFIRNWRYLEIALSIPSLVLLFYWWIIPESPRWLASRGRKDEALSILQRVADSNKTKLPEVTEMSDFLGKEDHLSFRQAFKCKELLLRVLFFTLYLFTTVLGYYGLTLNITNLSGDIFINFLISTVVETVAYTCCMVMLEKMGRKRVCTSSLLLAGTACCLSVFPVVFEWPGWTTMSVSMVGRFGICIAITAIYVYGAELFPTVVRSTALNVGVSFGRSGGIISPYVADMGMIIQGPFSEVMPLLVMGAPCLVMALATLWMPETHRIKLPDTLEDLQRSKSEKRRRFQCCSSEKMDDLELYTQTDGPAMESARATVEA